jgi:hypothetical protein
MTPFPEQPRQDDQTAGFEGQPTEEEMRAAYEAQLSQITSMDVILQTVVTLLNLGGRRLGLVGAPGSSPREQRDLEQVREAVDAVRALLPILERSAPQELRPLRDALSQLQLAYARETQGSGGESQAPDRGAPGEQAAAEGAATEAERDAPRSSGEPSQGGAQPDQDSAGQDSRGPGPAQSSGRLWVPGS